ncbi:10 kDa chaperonin [Bienertia sinuspersici]
MSNPTHHNVLIKVVPADKVVTKQRGPSTRSHEVTKERKTYNKSSGSYVRHTSKKSHSSGDYSSSGKTGYKDERKVSSTVRIGDKGGYTEYYKQEKVTRVNYDSGRNSGGSKGYIGSNKGKGHGGDNMGYKNKYLH